MLWSGYQTALVRRGRRDLVHGALTMAAWNGMNGLTDLERAVLEKLLDGDHPILAALREQMAGVRLKRREHTDAGFFCDLDAPPPVPEIAHVACTLSDVEAKLGGVSHGASFVLMIKRGRLVLLEGITQDGPWPAAVDSFELDYASQPRDLSGLD